MRSAVVASMLCVSSVALAQKAPELGYMYPPVVRAGQTENVQLGGYDLTSDLQFLSHDPRITIQSDGELTDFFVPQPPYWFGEKGFQPAFPLPREVTARVTVPDDIPAGIFRWQVANANGPSAAATFYVSDSHEVIETRFRDQPQLLEQIPIAVSGRLSRLAEVDRYEFMAPESGVVRVALQARQLGADFNGVLTIRDQAGRRIADAADTEGKDLVLDFNAVANQRFGIALHDIDYRGHRSFVYRLSITSGEMIASVQRDGDTASPQLSVPGDVTRVMDSTGKASFQFAASKDQWLGIAAESRAIGTNLDLAIAIVDSSGKELARADDLPGTEDAGLDFKVPADGTYELIVRDLSGRRIDSNSVYRVAIHQQAPTFSLSMPPQIAVPLGGSATMAIKVKRIGGFAGEIKIAAKGLPQGVTIADAVIPAKKKELKLAISAAADAEVSASPMQIVGTATIDEQAVQRSATAIAAGNLCPRDPSDDQVGFSLLAVTMSPPFTLELVDKNRQRAVHRGTTYPAPFVIRRNDGYDQPITLQMASKQGRHRQGIRGPIVTVPKNRDQAEYPCFLPEWLATDRTSRMVVHGVGAVKDPQGKERFVMTPANARVTMILEGALLKLAHRAAELSVRSGESFEVPIELSRSAKLQTDVDVTLIPPPEITGLLVAEPLRLDAETEAATMRIQTAADPNLAGRWTLLLKATTLENGRWPVVSQTEVEVDFGP